MWWFSSWRAQVSSSRNPSHGPRKRRPAFVKPWAEVLEDRTAPAVVTWDGGGGNFDWSTPANWSGDVLPGAGDDVVIDFGAIDSTLTFAGGNSTVNSLTCHVPLVVSGGEFLMAADSHL